jgi:hypothetical protein
MYTNFLVSLMRMKHHTRKIHLTLLADYQVKPLLPSRVSRVGRTGAEVEPGLSRPKQKRRRVTWGRRCASVEIPVVEHLLQILLGRESLEAGYLSQSSP